MDHREIRAIRGALSRAAFARLLGVSALTVLRWELADDEKEARRPRAKMIELLQQLAAEGVGRGAANATTGDESEDEDEDAHASEPATRPRTPSSSPGPDSARGDEARLLPVLDQLMGNAWRGAEDELLRLIASEKLTTPAGRLLATLGLLH